MSSSRLMLALCPMLEIMAVLRIYEESSLPVVLMRTARG